MPNLAQRLQQQNEEIIAKFDELKTQIEDLRTNNNRNTKWLSNIIIQEGEKVTLRDFFSTLTSEIKELNFEIRAIELSDEYTAEEKLVQLAALNDNKHLENIRLAIFGSPFK